MKQIFSYNFNLKDIHDLDFEALYKYRRRNSLFTCVFTHQKYIYAFRDHLGIAALYYRFIKGKWCFSSNPLDLITQNDTINPLGLRYYLGLGTFKLHPIVKGLNIVPPGAVIKFQPGKSKPQKIYQYIINPTSLPSTVTTGYLVDRLEKIFIKAIERIIVTYQVGLFLSGGIDSGLIAIYLNKLGVKVNAYTSAPWGKLSSEIPFALTSAQIAKVNRHYIDTLDSTNYFTLFNQLFDLYSLPHANTSSLAIANLFKHTPLKRETQVFIGQNCDNLTGSMPMQNWIFSLSFLPKFVKTMTKFKGQHWINDYIGLKTKGFVDHHPFFDRYYLPNKSLNRIQLLTLASQVVTNTQWASESFVQPLLTHNILPANPYWDMDLIEWRLSLPYRYRFSFKPDSLTKLVLDKNLFQHLASRYLPPDQAHRKKVFLSPKTIADKPKIFFTLFHQTLAA